MSVTDFIYKHGQEWLKFAWGYISRRFQYARVLDPEKFDLDLFRGEKLHGRDRDTQRILRDILEHDFIKIVGPSGTGKSTLIREKVLTSLEAEPSLLFLYVKTWGDSWDDGPIDSLFAAVKHSLQKIHLEGLCSENIKGQQGGVFGIIRVLAEEKNRVPVLVFDQLDEYQLSHREKFVCDDDEMKSWQEVIGSNAFWKRIDELLQRKLIKLIFITQSRDSDLAGALEWKTPHRIIVSQLPTELVRPILDELDEFVENRSFGWDQLKEKIAEDLACNKYILPVRLAVSVRGLPFMSNSRLTVPYYLANGGAEGLEEVYIRRSIDEAANRAYEFDEAVSSSSVGDMLASMIDNSNGGHAIARSVGELSKIANIQTEKNAHAILDCLKGNRLVRRCSAGTEQDSQTQWTLYHEYLADGITRFRETNPESRRLQLRHSDYVNSKGIWAKIWNLLWPLEQLFFLIYRFRWIFGSKTNFRYGPHWLFAIGSLVTWLSIFVALWLGFSYLNSINESSETDKLVSAISSMPPEKIPATTRRFSSANAKLLSVRLRSISMDDPGAVNIVIALNAMGEFDTKDRFMKDVLLSSYERAAIKDLTPISEALFQTDGSPEKSLWGVACEGGNSRERRFKAFLCLAKNGMQSHDWKSVAAFVAKEAADYVSRSASELGAVAECLKARSDALAGEFSRIALDRSEQPTIRQNAGLLLVEIANLDVAVEYLVSIREPDHLRFVIDRLRKMHGDDLLRRLKVKSTKSDLQVANSVVSQIFLLRPDVNPVGRDEALLLATKHLSRNSYIIGKEDDPPTISGGDPTKRTKLQERISQLLTMDQIAVLLDESLGSDVLAALVMSIGQSSEPISDKIGETIKALNTRRDDPELSSAVYWLFVGRDRGREFEAIVSDGQLRAEISKRLRDSGNKAFETRNGDPKTISMALKSLGTGEPTDFFPKRRRNANQYETAKRISMVKINGGRGVFGKPRREPYDQNDEEFEIIEVPSFEISTTEVTFDLYSEFYSENLNKEFRAGQRTFALHRCSPATRTTWFGAVKFCNWLNEKEGIKDENRWCYLPNTDGEYGPGMRVMTGPNRDGFRLPTNLEWEYACRAGSRSRWSCGDDPADLRRYSCYFNNSFECLWPVASRMPNAFGLFDMHGNAQEWCHDRVIEEGAVVPYVEKETVIGKDDLFGIRGGEIYYRNLLVRSAFRDDRVGSEAMRGIIGFRVARSVSNNDEKRIPAASP